MLIRTLFHNIHSRSKLISLDIGNKYEHHQHKTKTGFSRLILIETSTKVPLPEANDSQETTTQLRKNEELLRNL